MKTIKRILVVADNHTGLRDAIAKASLLEHYSGAEIEITSVISNTICTSNGEVSVGACIREEEQQLQELVEPFRDEVAWCKTNVVWNVDPLDAVTSLAHSSTADLIIKPLAHHGPGDYLHTPLDWQLIRTLKTPLLLSKHQDWSTGGKVLAALDTADKHQALNRIICAQAEAMAGLLDAELHLVTVTSGPLHTVSAGLIKKAQERRLKDLNCIARENGLEKFQPHGLLGDPVSVIRETSQSLAPTVTIIGTHARGGFKKLLLGNTAEAVIPKIESDVITVSLG